MIVIAYLIIFILHCSFQVIQATYSTQAQECINHNKLDQAFEYLSKELEDQPEDNEAMLCLGNQLLQLGNRYFDIHETEKAIETYKKIFTLTVPHHMVYHNIGFIVSEQKNAYEESLDYYRAALALKPDDANTHLCYGISLLATGNFIAGFQEYEWRLRLSNKSTMNQTNYPLHNAWMGQPVQGKRILLLCEQGLGDTFMFIRYAQLLKARGATIIVQTVRQTAPILSLCPYIDTVLLYGDLLPSFDYQIHLLSLPTAFATTVETIPSTIPYLYPNEGLVQQWKKVLQVDKKLKIGICWQGNRSRSINRFVPLHYFEQIAKCNDISVYSLQKNEPTDACNLTQQTKETGIQHIAEDFDESHGSFMDTAALIKNIDLVITVDTSIAHLAGSLGIATWVLLPFAAEWRWLPGLKEYEHVSPWYPTMRLFRQKAPGDWHSVMQEVVDALKKYPRLLRVLSQ